MFYGKQACRTIYTAHGQVCIAFVCFFDVSNGTGDVAHYGLIRRTGQDAECMADMDIWLVGSDWVRCEYGGVERM
jgi:hypothetical protein